MTEMTTTIIVGLLIPLLGTMLGSAFVFFMKDEMSARLQKTLLGFASGVMVAASVWSLLIPAMEMKADSGAWSVVPAAVGFLMGIGFLLLIDELTPHLHIGTDKPEGIKSHLSKTAMLALAVTIHNLPEGMAVGVVFAGAENGSSHISLAAAISVSLGIAIQNIPEGAIISMPMRAAGNSRWKSFVLGSLSGVVEPIGAIAVLLLASLLMPALPYMLAFAAGAMFYVVVEELIPEASSGQHSNLSTIGFAIGFVLMFIPNETSYIAAMKQQPDLSRYAYQKKIIIISPSNLLMALQLAYNLWQYDRQNKNVEKIVKTAADLYDKVAGFEDTFMSVGDLITRLSGTFDKAKKQLYDGTGNVMRRVESLKGLGVTPKKQIKELDNL